MNKKLVRNITWLTLFSIAMAYLESAVVVYLRELFYPQGFDFPLQPISPKVATVEFWREVATIVMLAGAGALAGKTAGQRFAGFVYSFAIWDIFYYIWLYVILGWPKGLMDWDILFLIPVPWVGPVITPIIITLLMITLAGLMWYFDAKGKKATLKWNDYFVFTIASLVLITSWTWDYWQYIKTIAPGESIWTLGADSDLFKSADAYLPEHFAWGIFLCSVTIFVLGILLYIRRMRRFSFS